MLDLLVFHPDVWVAIVEAKRSYYSLEAAIPQVLFYMLGKAEVGCPAFGLVTNGREFQFVKLLKTERVQYGLSYTLSLNRGDDLHYVARGLHALAQRVVEGRAAA